MTKSKHSVIDCYNDRMMIAEGLRVRHLTINRETFKKSDEEKSLLSTAKYQYRKMLKQKS